MADPRVRPAAQHEARHGAVAMHVSMRLDYLTVDPTHPSSPDGSAGYTRALPKDGELSVYDKLLFDLAGYMGDEEYAGAWPPPLSVANVGECLAPANHDLHQIGRSLRLLREGGLTDEQVQVAYESACEEVRQVLALPHVARAVRLLSMALLRHRSLTGEDVAILLGAVA